MGKVQTILSKVALQASSKASSSNNKSPAVGDFVDIITFVEKVDWGLKMKLFPVQRVILKAHYGIPLDDTVKFEVSDWNRDNVQHFTEAEYLQFLFDTGRSNIREVTPGHERRNLILSIGRRSGKSTLAAAIAAYEVYKLIHKLDPHKYYGLAASQIFSLIAVATGREQAGELYSKVSGHFDACAFFRRFRSAVTQTSARFQSPTDIRKHGSCLENPKARASIRVSFHACNAKSLRGKGNIVVILDEFAHFVKEGGSSDEEVYQALSPSTSDFAPKDAQGLPLHGPTTQSEARMILISSPLGKEGLFYKQFQLGLGGGQVADSMLCIQAPTWEVNPSLPAGEFRQQFALNPIVFRTEYGAEFSDRSLGWIEEASDLWECVDPNLRPAHMGSPRHQYYLGFDLGFVKDASAAAIVHHEGDKLVLDYIEEIRAGHGKYKNHDRLEIDEVALWLADLSRRFSVREGIFDQWNNVPMEQALAKLGIRHIHSEFMGSQLNSQIYQNLKALIWDRKIRLFDITEQQRLQYVSKGEEPPEHAPYLIQLLELQAEVRSKYIIDVRAPNLQGKHDDMADALARAVWLASQNMGKKNIVAGGSRALTSRDAALTRSAISGQLRLHQKLRASGTSPERQIPRMMGRRRLFGM